MLFAEKWLVSDSRRFGFITRFLAFFGVFLFLLFLNLNFIAPKNSSFFKFYFLT